MTHCTLLVVCVRLSSESYYREIAFTHASLSALRTEIARTFSCDEADIVRLVKKDDVEILCDADVERLTISDRVHVYIASAGPTTGG